MGGEGVTLGDKLTVRVAIWMGACLGSFSQVMSNAWNRIANTRLVPRLFDWRIGRGMASLFMTSGEAISTRNG